MRRIVTAPRLLAHLVVLILAIALGLVAASPAAANVSILWTSQFGSASGDGATAVAVAGTAVYVVGTTTGTLPNQQSQGGSDVFVRRYDSSGTVVWTRQFGSPADDLARTAAVDASGSVYVAGSTTGTLTSLGNPLTALGGRDAFVRKYDASGNEVWTTQFGSADSDAANVVAVDASANPQVYVAEDHLTPVGVFLGIRSLNASTGAPVRDRLITSGRAVGVAVDAGANVYVTGDTASALSSTDETAAQPQTAPAQDDCLPALQCGHPDGFLRKYTPSLDERWTRQFGNGEATFPAVVAVGGPSGAQRVYVGGIDCCGLAGATGTGQLFVRQYDTDGTRQWTRKLGGQFSAGDRLSALAADAAGGVYAAGSTSITLISADGVGQSPAGAQDAFVRKYDSGGSEQWTRQFGTAAAESLGANGVAAGAFAGVYVAGGTGGTLPGQASQGSFDAFVVKIGAAQAPPPGIEGPPGDASCADGGDNDGDGLVDGADPDCQPPAPPVPPSVSCNLTAPGVNVILGTSGRDTLVGTAGDDVILGLGGNDSINGVGGNDCLDGGAGADSITTGDGNDIVFGGDGDDGIAAGPGLAPARHDGDDAIVAGAGNDHVRDLGGTNTILAGDGDDSVVIGRRIEIKIILGTGSVIPPGRVLPPTVGDSTIRAGDGADWVRVDRSEGEHEIHGEAGDDAVSGGVGNEIIDGGEGMDRIDGGSGWDTIDGGAGNDRIDGGDGSDTIDGGAENDTIFGDARPLGNRIVTVENDRIEGGAGNDTIFGEGGSDSIEGGLGDDTIDGGAGDDSLSGGPQHDTLRGGLGDDTIDGGVGDDFLSGGLGIDSFDGGDGFDTCHQARGELAINCEV